MDDECIRARIRSHVFSSSLKFNSSSQSAFSGRIEGDCFVLIIEYIFEIATFNDVYRSKISSSIFLFGKKGKLENCLPIKLRIWKYLNKWELGKSNLSLSCVKDAKLLAMYSWLTVAKPCSLQMLKAPSIKEGGKEILQKTGAWIQGSLRSNAKRNWDQILNECLTTVFFY